MTAFKRITIAPGMADPLAERLYRAIANDEIYLHYQPIVDAHTKRLIGTEALVRWQDPDIGVIPPAAFIPLAEQSGLIQVLSAWVLNQALFQAREWKRAGLEIPVSINLSPWCLQDPRLPEQVAELLVRWELGPESLEFELTEGDGLEDLTSAIQTLQRLRQTGVRVSLDDFGRESASLTRFKTLPLDAIKIDRSFTQGVLRNSADWAIVHALTDMAQIMGRKVIAKGVESQAVFDILARVGCDAIQGYFTGLPVPAAEISRCWLRTESA